MATHRHSYTWLMVAAGLLVLPAALPAQEGLSHVRVVRVSYVHGTVAIKRPGATEWAKAMVNTPIQEGFALSTSSDSYAEVQFENGSTARLGELSELDFTQLALAPDGSKLNRMTFAQGYGTFHFVPEKGDVYAVKVADVTLTPRGKSEFRTDLEKDQLQVEVFTGGVEAASPIRTEKLGKGKVLDYGVQTAQAFNVHEGIQKDSWDQWTEARDRQSDLALQDAAVGMNRGMYGWSDLDTYGEWAYLPGYGYGWAPYAPMGWSPYSMGMWDMYPGFGWTWTSAEPWGWLPYHYGSWGYDPMFGWFWMPGMLNAWSPCLVTWYQGPGWIGWTPAGVAPTAGTGVIAVAPGTVATGQPINSTRIVRVDTKEAAKISGPTFQASGAALLSGSPLGHNVALPSAAAFGIQTALMARSRPAPPTVLMGNNAEKEQAELNTHQSFWKRALGGSNPQPLRVHMGRTLGGHFPASSEAELHSAMRAHGMEGAREMDRSTSPDGSRHMGRSGPMILQHGSARGTARASEGMGTGASAGGWGRGGGSISSSSSSTSTPASSVSSPSMSSGGGHGGGGGRGHD